MKQKSKYHGRNSISNTDYNNYIGCNNDNIHQKVEKYADKSFSVTLPEATEYEIISWVLAQAGLATLIAPKRLTSQIAKIAMVLYEKHGFQKEK